VEDLRQSPNGEQADARTDLQITRSSRFSGRRRWTNSQGEILRREGGGRQISGTQHHQRLQFTLCTLKSGLFLQIDVCSRVFRSFNFLEELMNQKNKEFKNSFLGSTLITNYGRRRTFRILRIC
jgi:hypothetical protein